MLCFLGGVEVKKEFLFEISNSAGHVFCKADDTYESFDDLRRSLDSAVYLLYGDKYLVEVFDKETYKKVSFYVDDGSYVGDKEEVMKKVRNLFSTGGQNDEKKTWSFTTVD